MSATDETRAARLSDAKHRVFSLRLHKLYADDSADFDAKLIAAERLVIELSGLADGTGPPITLPTAEPAVCVPTVAVDITTVDDVSAEDAARALHAASAAVAAAMVAKAAALALVLATREPAGPARVYTLMDMGDDGMSPTVMVDVRASTEGRAWVEMAYHSPRFAMAIKRFSNVHVAGWDELMRAIMCEYPCRFVVVHKSAE